MSEKRTEPRNDSDEAFELKHIKIEGELDYRSKSFKSKCELYIWSPSWRWTGHKYERSPKHTDGIDKILQGHLWHSSNNGKWIFWSFLQGGPLPSSYMTVL